jgi:hypothetical protein
VQEVDGKLEELGNAPKESKQQFWNQMVWLQKYQGWSKGRASHTYRDKFGVWPRGLIDDRPEPVSLETKSFIDKKMRQFLKSIGKR